MTILCATVTVQSRFAETRFAETLTLTLNPNFGESGFGESGRHHCNTSFTFSYIMEYLEYNMHCIVLVSANWIDHLEFVWGP